jgi:hypothetical protein
LKLLKIKIKRLFDASSEIKKMFKFANSLDSVADMMQNTMIRYHANLIVETLDKIVILLTKSLISEQDKENIIELGKKHYHFGLKKEHFKVLF